MPTRKNALPYDWVFRITFSLSNVSPSVRSRFFGFTYACAALQELQKLEPTQAFWHNLLGKILSTLHRHDEANAHFRTCIRLNPQILEAHHLLAQNLARAGAHTPAEYGEAIAVARRCLESAEAYPSLPDVHVLLADTLHSSGQYKLAVQVRSLICVLFRAPLPLETLFVVSFRSRHGSDLI